MTTEKGFSSIMNKELKNDILHLISVDIRYEESKGIHTYHDCNCGRLQTRKGICAICLRELKAQLELGIEPENFRSKRIKEIYDGYIKWLNENQK